ncbi:putative multidrug resistance protein MdtD [Nanobdella aerobiophila]|uniref:Multidrug resistance protein MdtD n=1 Tax=Nanobdella aerobiophila TaxID=2586965 RepID=A0A915SKN7_9ARCH|nr:MFS transporter [Nanobdella aerobiophila]BBL45466.1 putative multidrug resistance protein MdtD [Nanobdella aerobiophila]
MNYNEKILLLLASMLLIINYVETMVVPALYTIQKDFGVSSNLAGWVTTSYMIVGAAASPIMGKLADVYGKKKLYLLAILFYNIAVSLAGFSPNIYFLIFARAIQGLGFAVFPIAISIIADLYSKERLAYAQGILSATLGIGPALGLLLGSYIVEYLGWQAAFHTAAILSAILLILSFKYLPITGKKVRESIDYFGSIILSISVGLFLVYLTLGSQYGWFNLSIIYLFTSILLIILFILYEKRIKEPLLKLEYFKIKNFAAANIIGIFSGIAMFSLFIFFTYYSQIPKPEGLGLSIIESGNIMSPISLGMLFFGPIIGKILPKRGPKPVIFLGILLSIISFILLIINRGTIIDLLFDGIFMSVGLSSLLIPIVNMVSISLPAEYRTTGLGLNTLLRSLGSAIGPILSTTLMQTYQVPLIDYLNNQYLVLGFLPSSTAFNYIGIFGIIFMIISAIFALFIENYKISEKQINMSH